MSPSRFLKELGDFEFGRHNQCNSEIEVQNGGLRSSFSPVTLPVEMQRQLSSLVPSSLDCSHRQQDSIFQGARVNEPSRAAMKAPCLFDADEESRESQQS